MHPQPEPFPLRDFASVAFWLLVKIVAGFGIGAALFETDGLDVGLISGGNGGQEATSNRTAYVCRVLYGGAGGQHSVLWPSPVLYRKRGIIASDHCSPAHLR